MSNIGNPFVECTSRDMSFHEVFCYWCDPFNCYNIDYLTLMRSTTPIIIEGPRGSGKTMILKYISYFCQKESILAKYPADQFLRRLMELGSIGLYFRYIDNFGALFKDLNCSKKSKERLFLFYFEMYILDELLKVLADIEDNDQEHAFEWKQLAQKISEILVEDDVQATHISQLLDLIQIKTRAIDLWVRKSRYLDSAENELYKLISGTSLVRGVCQVASECVSILRNAKFIIIIDEYENASDYQVMLNTLLKQVDHTSNISYRIGTRPKGMKTMETSIGSEHLQIDRDFLLYVLQLQEMKNYKSLIKLIVKKRLESIDFFKQHDLTDISELLGKSSNLDEEAEAVVRGRTKHFEVLKSTMNTKEYLRVVKEIQRPGAPLMEMLNTIWVLRGVPAEKVRSAMESYIAGEFKNNDRAEDAEDGYKYKLDYSDKYRYQLLFILLGIYGQNKKYYSFNTFAYLSSGAVNDFISLCRNVFYLLDESYYDHVESTSNIPIALQAKGAENTAIEQMDKIKLCSPNGTEMYTFAMNIGSYFKLLHRDISAKYPETNQFAFENENEIESRAVLKSVRNSLIEWGVIIKRPRVQSISIGRRKGTLFYLNRILSPIFNISFRTRGGYNFVLATDLFESLIKESWEAGKIASWKKTDAFAKGNTEKTRKKVTEENVKTKPEPVQLSLFEVDDQ